jgi:hypothetical protein
MQVEIQERTIKGLDWKQRWEAATETSTGATGMKQFYT